MHSFSIQQSNAWHPRLDAMTIGSLSWPEELALTFLIPRYTRIDDATDLLARRGSKQLPLHIPFFVARPFQAAARHTHRHVVLVFSSADLCATACRSINLRLRPTTISLTKWIDWCHRATQLRHQAIGRSLAYGS
jgi:hypothetical protein